jgi:hypothetical protein
MTKNPPATKMEEKMNMRAWGIALRDLRLKNGVLYVQIDKIKGYSCIPLMAMRTPW